MAIDPVPVASQKTRYILTLLSGTSWTVPAGVTYINVCLKGAGGGGAQVGTNAFTSTNDWPSEGADGAAIWSSFATTPGNSITYAIGAGGGPGTGGNNNNGLVGGSTTMTGATTAPGGQGGTNANNGTKVHGPDGTVGGGGKGGKISIDSTVAAGTGGPGSIDIEYWA